MSVPQVATRGAINWPTAPPSDGGSVAAQNVGAGAGEVFRDQVPPGTLNFRTITPGPGSAITVATVGDEVRIGQTPGSLQRFARFSAETNAQQGNRRVRNIGATGNFDFNFYVPSDFGALVAFAASGSSRTATDATANNVTLMSTYMQQPGGAIGAFGETANITQTFVAGFGFLMDLTPAVQATPLAADMEGGVNIDHQGIGGSADYYELVMVYTPA